MVVNWVRVYNRLFELLNTTGPMYFSGPRFISKIREVDPHFPNYNQYLEARRLDGKSTSRSDYFYDILLSFNESQRQELISALLVDLREHAAEKVAALEAELAGAGAPVKPTPAIARAPPVQAEAAVPLSGTSSVQARPAPEPQTPNAVKVFWIKHWQWVIGTAVAVAGVIAAFVKG